MNPYEAPRLQSHTQPPKRPPGNLVVGWIGCYTLILLFEYLTIPLGSHSNSWRGVWISLLALPMMANSLGRSGVSSSRMFLFGTGSSFLFVPRFLGMDRFTSWLLNKAPSDAAILLSWAGFALVLGTACMISSQAFRKRLVRTQLSEDDAAYD